VVERTYPVGTVARTAGITVRTLHHYDAIGLLRPTGRAGNGYRRYSDADLERLQRILFYRELGFDLDRIKRALTDPDTDPLEHLRQQHALLTARIERLQHLVDAVAHAMEAHTMDIKLTPEERLEVFGDVDPDEHGDEVKDRWGDTDAYRESQRRAARYTKQDWVRIRTESEAVTRQMVDAMASGLPPTSPQAMDAAEAHRRQIDSSFYPCTLEMHKALAEMYLADARFAANYEAMAPGMAEYVHDAIEANARRHGGPAVL
jgi:MerR family transcriptional regulator, thiopeptide resistance regulator